MTRTTIVIAAGLAFAAVLPAIPAQALVARSFVSAAGSDSNNCANVLTPCRHLAAAYAVTAANGEIYVLDPANYGSLTITGPVSIEVMAGLRLRHQSIIRRSPSTRTRATKSTSSGWCSMGPTSHSPAASYSTPAEA